MKRAPTLFILAASAILAAILIPRGICDGDFPRHATSGLFMLREGIFPPIASDQFFALMDLWTGFLMHTFHHEIVTNIAAYMAYLISWFVFYRIVQEYQQELGERPTWETLALVAAHPVVLVAGGTRGDYIYSLLLVDALEERLALCPASGRLEYHNAFPGGLVEHSLRVLSNATKIVKAFEWNVKKESLIIGCLFHDLGKVGDEDNDYYLPQDSDWHREKLGEVFVHNKKMQYMTVPQRSVYMMQRFGVRLELDEYLAILLNDGWVLQENKPYCLKEPILVTVVQHADYIATVQEKESLTKHALS